MESMEIIAVIVVAGFALVLASIYVVAALLDRRRSDEVEQDRGRASPMGPDEGPVERPVGPRDTELD